MIHLSMIMAPAQREMKTSSSAERIILLIAWWCGALCFPRKKYGNNFSLGKNDIAVGGGGEGGNPFLLMTHTTTNS